MRVDDQAGPSTPSVRVTEGDEETGRGLAIVGLLSARWGVDGDETARSVWAEITFDEPAIPGSQGPATDIPQPLRAIRSFGTAMNEWVR